MTIINPKVALEKGWISGVKDPKQVQPNAIDFTLDRAFKLNDYIPFVMSESHKIMKGSTEITPWDFKDDLVGWRIEDGEMLDGLSNVYCDLPEGVCAQLVIRSSLARNGLLLTSGLYDSGFKGHIGFVLHNRSENYCILGEGVRVGQVILFQADSAGLYAGGYNHGQGTALKYQQKCGCQSEFDERGREIHGSSCKAMGLK